MAHFVFGPDWFLGTDVLIDVFSLITLLLIAFFSYRCYTFNKEKTTYMYLGIAFLVLGISFFAKIMTYVVIYYYQFLHLADISIVQQALTTKVVGMRPSYFIFSAGIAAFRFLHLIGLYMLTCIYQKRVSRYDTLIISFLFVIVTVFSHNSYYAFYATALVLLLIVSTLYYEVYKRGRNKNTFILMSSFVVIALSQAIFIFKTIDPVYYVWGQVLQLVGYFLLLVTFIMVIRNGKKKKQTRHSL